MLPSRTPVSVVAALEELHQRLTAADLADRERKLRVRSRSR
jgi:hypothetical protein